MDSTLVDVVIDMYDRGKITRPSAATIIHAARVGVNWCDGNEDEAVDSILMKRCGCCLRRMDSGEALYPVFQFYMDWPYPVEENFAETLATFRLCADCYDELVGKNTGDPTAGPKARRGIEATVKQNYWQKKGR